MDEEVEKAAFQKQVANEFYQYKSLNDAESISVEELKRGFRGTGFGCLFSPLMSLLDRFGKNTLRKEREKRNYDDFEIKTHSLLGQSEIREAIRNAFEELPKNEIVTEETFVRVFTETLSQDELRQRLDIPLDPILFAMVGYGIFKKGIREFCGGGG
jgi:hypothetical protein